MGNLVVELSTGHVFVAESVRAITPLRNPSQGGYIFDVVGVGYVVQIPFTIGWSRFEKGQYVFDPEDIKKVMAIRDEFVEKLLGHTSTTRP